MITISPLDELTVAPNRTRSPMDTSSDCLDYVVGEIDFGKSPEGVLVVREWHGPRLLAIVLAIVVAIPWLLIVLQIVHDENNAGKAVHFGDVLSWLLLTLMPGILLAGSVVLFAQWLNGAYYYLALDEHHLYRRRGPRRLLVLPLDDLGPFVLVGRRRDCLAVEHVPERRMLKLLKNAYAPERLSIVAQRLNTFRASSPATHSTQQARTNYESVRQMKAAGTASLLIGLLSVCFFPTLFVLIAVVKLPVPSILLSCIAGALFAVGQIVWGTVLLLRARGLHHSP